MNEHAFDVLRALADGQFHSGEAIGVRLGVSRTVVWQAVHAVEAELGVPVYSVRGQGYRLAAPFDALDAVAARARLSPQAAASFCLEALDRTDSTNTRLMARAADGAPHGLVLAAERQSAGRGRLGRRWQAALGSGLTFSLLWRFSRSVAELSGLSLAVGVAMVRALSRLGAPVALKWPNDVLLDGRKLAGILIELSGDALGPATVVIGMGINVADPGEVDQPVASLRDAGVAACRNEIWAALLDELHAVLSVFDREGFLAFRDEWSGYAAHRGAPVRLSFSHGEPIDGVALGVDDAGALRVDTGAGIRTFHVGEVSLRPREAP